MKSSMKTICTLAVLVLFTLAVACGSTSDSSSTTVGGAHRAPVGHSHQLLEY